MSLRAVAIAAGASRKWVLNAQALLGLVRDAVPARARELALTRLLEEEGFRLGDAHARALRLLAAEARGDAWPALGRTGVVGVTVDRARFETVFALRRAVAAGVSDEERRGRPRAVREGALAQAERYGTDLSLLAASLRRTVAERLDRLDADAAFLRSLRVLSR